MAITTFYEYEKKNTADFRVRNEVAIKKNREYYNEISPFYRSELEKSGTQKREKEKKNRKFIQK